MGSKRPAPAFTAIKASALITRLNDTLIIVAQTYPRQIERINIERANVLL
jgi:hypothetical protein